MVREGSGGTNPRISCSRRGMQERFDVESVTTPSGVTHVTFTRSDVP